VNAIKVINISTLFNKRKKVAKKEKLLLLYCKHFLGLDTIHSPFPSVPFPQWEKGKPVILHNSCHLRGKDVRKDRKGA